MMKYILRLTILSLVVAGLACSSTKGTVFEETEVVEKQKPDQAQQEYSALLNGAAENKPGGETFSYEWLQETAESGAIPWMTPEVVDCIAGEAKSNEAYTKDGAIAATALDELGEKCGYNAFEGIECPDGSPAVNGVCSETKTVAYCLDGSEPVDGKCVLPALQAGEASASGDGGVPPAVPLKCPDGKDPDANGLCFKEEVIQYCPDLSAPVNGKCSIASSGTFSNLCSDGTVPVDGKCPQSTEGGAAAAAPGVASCENCSLSFQVIWPKNWGGQISNLVRPYITAGSKIAKGDLYLRLCADAECKDPKFITKVDTINVPSTGKAYPKSVSSLPEGDYFAQLIFNTAYRKEWHGSCTGLTDCPGPFDVVQTSVASLKPEDKSLSMNNNYDAANNPPAATTQVSIHGPTTIAEPLYLGHFEFDRSIHSPAQPEPGYLMVAASKGTYRNSIRFVNLMTSQVGESLVLKLGGQDFDGDICGFVPAEKNVVYALGYGHGKCGGYVFKTMTDDLDPTKVVQDQAWGSVFIPHPQNANATQDVAACSTFDVTLMPHPCRGTYVAQGNLLYNVEFKGAGSLKGSLPYPVMGIDLNKKMVVENGTGLVSSVYKDVEKRAVRGVVNDGKNVYLLEASWSKANPEKINKIWKFAIDQTTGKLIDTAAPAVKEGTANFSCGMNYPPAFASYTSGNDRYIVTGSDTSVFFYKVQNDTLVKVGEVDVSGYGRQFTEFALSPSEGKLYAVATCNAEKMMNILSGKPGTTKTVTVDRHLVAVFDLAKSDGNGLPPLIYTDRDFDGDGLADGGVDVESTALKAYITRYAENASGVVPSLSFVGIKIAAAEMFNFFIGGTGIKGDGEMSIDSSGVGQLADIGHYSIDAHALKYWEVDGKTDTVLDNTIVHRDYLPWLNGSGSKESMDNLKACGRWGVDLDESAPELSTGPLMVVSPSRKWDPGPVLALPIKKALGAVCAAAGECENGLVCQAGICALPCVPQCSGKACGEDGCGGTCGTCAEGSSCTAEGQCVAVCQPNCANKACGGDGCGGSCGACAEGMSCNDAGQCVVPPPSCAPNCTGKACGEDGCGGICGTCAATDACTDGVCVAPAPVPECATMKDCKDGQVCKAGKCLAGDKECRVGNDMSCGKNKVCIFSPQATADDISHNYGMCFSKVSCKVDDDCLDIGKKLQGVSYCDNKGESSDEYNYVCRILMTYGSTGEGGGCEETSQCVQGLTCKKKTGKQFGRCLQ